MKASFAKLVVLVAFMAMGPAYAQVVSLEVLPALYPDQEIALSDVLNTPQVVAKIVFIQKNFASEKPLLALSFSADPSFRGRYQESVLGLGLRDSKGKLVAIGELDIRLFTDPSIEDSAQFRPLNE